MEYIKAVIRFFVRNIAKILFIFPIKKNRILFTSRDGEDIADNPRYIFDFLYDNYSDKLEYIWVYNGSMGNKNFGKDVKIIKRHTISWFYYMETSKVVINNYAPALGVPKRKDQFYIETWHAGGAYKKVGGESSKLKIGPRNSYRSMNSYIDLFISSSKAFTKYNIKEGYHYKGKILNSGMPRNDVFFNHDAVKRYSAKVRNYYSLDGPIVLYAPTFRGEFSDSEEMDTAFNAERLCETLEKRYNQNVNVLVRCHPADKHHYNFGTRIIDASNYPDMQELLCASDILITDYSSCMWDYALLGRPCLLYTPDIDEYIRERGFFVPADKWPGIICRTMDELCDTAMNFSEEECAAKDENHLKYMGSYETGHATETISERIVEYIKGV